jgi:hypothetical protein
MPLEPLATYPALSSKPGQRRHSPKGKAVGWLKERLGNTKREKPSVSYFYCWDDIKSGQLT